MKNGYIYLRVSTDEQAKEGFSLENQKLSCREYAQRNGYRVKKLFEDDGKSARTLARPAFQKLLEAVEKDKPDAIIFYKIDRFARNLADFANLRQDFRNKEIKLLSVSDGDFTDGPLGGMLAVWAEWESELNGQRTRDALMQKFREGWQPSPLYIGYRSIGGDRERKTCEPDPYVAPIIKELFELYATGNYSILALQEWLSNKNVISRNGTGLGHSVICNILNNPFYHGWIRWHGEGKVGNHTPIISKELFDTCQYVLAKHRSFLVRKRKYDYLLRGFLYCHYCDQRYTAEPHPNHSINNPSNIDYYHCQKRGRNGCPAPYVEMSKLESLVEQEFKKLEFSEVFVSTVINKTKEVLEQNRSSASSVKQGLLNQISALEIRRNNLEDVLLDGTIDRESFKRRHDELQRQIMNLNDQLIDIESKGKIDIDLIEEVLAFTRNIHQAYMEAPKFLKRHYLRFFFEKIVVKNRKIYKVVPTPIFKLLKNRHEIIIRNSWLRGRDSNPEPRS